MLPQLLDLNWNDVWCRQQHKDIIRNRCTSIHSSDSLARTHTNSRRMVYAADDRSNPASTTDASTNTVPYNVHGCVHTIFVQKPPNCADLIAAPWADLQITTRQAPVDLNVGPGRTSLVGSGLTRPPILRLHVRVQLLARNQHVRLQLLAHSCNCRPTTRNQHIWRLHLWLQMRLQLWACIRHL